MDWELSPEEQENFDKLKDPTSPKQAYYGFDKGVQQDILSLMLHERSFMVQAMHLVKPQYFIDKAHIEICKILREWFEKHITHISGEREVWIHEKYVRDQLNERLKENPAKLYYLAELQTILDSYVQGLTSRSYCLEKVVNFAKDQEIGLAIQETLLLLKSRDGENKYDKIKARWDKALLVGPQMDLGLNYFQDIEERYKRMAEDRSGKDRFSSGFHQINEGIVGKGLSRGEIGGYEASSGGRKCFAKNTPILMFDGTIKMVQDVEIGDLVMGDDSNPRKVLSTHSGRDVMYKVVPVKGDPYVVNGDHILCLKCTSSKFWKTSVYRKGSVFNISVNDFLKQSKSFRNSMKTWRTGVSFPNKDVKIDPYILGVWLGDGDKDTSAFITMDNSFVNDLRYYNLLHNKHIPDDYKINSRKVRLQVLAGILDTDGYVHHNNYGFTNKNKTLAEDVVYLARSLGFAAHIKECNKQCCNNGKWGVYWNVSISGDCSEIPVKIPHKKCKTRKQIKRHFVSGIKIETMKKDDFYGFSVDGNHLFLLGDFTVVHNSWFLCKAAIENIRLGHRVLLVTLEMNQDKTAERFDTLFTGVNPDDLLIEGNYVKKKLDVEIKTALLNLESLIGKDRDRLFIKHFSAGSADVQTIRAYYSQLALRGLKPDLLIVDYIGEFKDFPGLKTYESRQRLMRDLRAFGVDEDHCTLTALQANRSGKVAQDDGFLEDSDLSDSYGQIRVMDYCWSINQNKKEAAANIGRIYVVKNRNGKMRYHFPFYHDPVTLAIRTITLDEYKDRKSAVKELKENEALMDPFEVIDTSKFIPNSGNEEANV